MDNSFWKPLNGNNCWISLKEAGDLGPSGWDEAAIARRQSAFLQLPVSGTRPDGHTSLVCRQIHSLAVLFALKGKPKIEARGVWDQADMLHVESGIMGDEDLDLPRFFGTHEADGVATDHPQMWPAVTVADCLPILITAYKIGSAEQPVRMALHSGWQGTGILAVVLVALARWGEWRITVSFGPCIAAADYAVPPDRAALFESRFGPKSVVVCADGQPGLDLVAANCAIISGTAPCLAGMPDLENWPRLEKQDSISVFGDSTFTTPWLQSYRRDGAGAYGRMLCMIGPTI